ncbi:hypothetical protein [Rhodococcus qingshengii]
MPNATARAAAEAKREISARHVINADAIAVSVIVVRRVAYSPKDANP